MAIPIRMLLAMALVVVPATGFSQDKAESLVFLGNHNIPPMIFVQNTKPAGLVVDLVQAMAERAGLKLEVRAMDWAEAQQKVKEGLADGLLQINSNPEREKFLDFSDPLLESQFCIFRKDSRLDIQSVDSLSGLTVGVEKKGYPFMLLQRYPEIEIRVIPSWRVGFELIKAGDIDAVVVDRWVGEYELFVHDIRGISIVDEPIVTDSSAIAVRKGEQRLLEKINKGLRMISEDGTRRAILDKWKKKEIVYLSQERLTAYWALIGMSLLVLLLLIVSLINMRRIRAANRVLAERGDALANEVAERRQAEQALRQSEKSLANAQKIASLGSWSLDLVANHLSWSDEIYRVFGIEKTAFGASYEAFLESIHPEDREYVDQQYQGALEGRFPYDIEHRIIRRNDGEVRWVHERCEHIHDEHGQVIRSDGTVQDITERREAQAELEKYRGQLEELVKSRTAELEVAKEAAESANRAKSVFLANMSHELRTPLNAILGFAQLMNQDERIPIDERQNLETINRSGRHLLSLINDVLEISKIEAGRLTLNPERVDLHELLSSLAEVMAIRARQKGLALHFEQAPVVPHYIEIDVTKLRQVLINLISNAVKFTKEGDVRIAVSCEKKEEGVLLVVDVIDTGVGIAEQDLENIFSPFYQTEHGITVGEGTGLGLTISREYTKLLGGQLSAESQVGKGSVLKLRLPVRPAEAPAAESEQQGEVISLASGQPSYRILVAEDNRDSQRLIGTLLERVGFEVHIVADGQQAVDQVHAWQPHFIWMDMRMPVLDGYEATRRIKAIPEGQNILIAALTASAFEEDREAVLASGCDGFVRKPIKPAELFKVMHDLLGVHYVYRDQAFAGVQETGHLDSAALATLPKELKDGLRAAAEQLDKEALIQVSERIHQHSEPLASTLKALGEGFRFDLVLSAIENSSSSEGYRLEWEGSSDSVKQ